MKLILCLIALITPLTLSATPNFPFPQKASYEYGIMPTNIDHEKVQAAYENFMKNFYVEQGDLARIKHDTPENSVSEGIAYGMLITVYMDNETNTTQSKFDKLWNYYKKFSNSVGGMMSWRISGFSGPASTIDQNAATDAELDAAVALLQAYKQWNDEKYLNDAKELLGKMAEHEVNENGYLKPGDSWDSEKNVSYFSTGALELYKEANDFDWEKVIQNSYSLIKKVRNSSTGLVPDWCSESGNPSGGSRGNYYYDATRTPWRIAWAYSWYGHQDAKDICTKIASWISSKTGGDHSKIVTGYALDGSEIDQWHNATFVGPLVCAGMVDAAHQNWVDKGYAYLSDMDETVYYQVSLKLLTMLYLSGNMPNFWTYNPIEKFTVTTSPTPQHGGTVSYSPEGTEFDGGTQVTLTAEPAEGYTFVSWSGDASGTTASTTVTILKDMNVTANFEIKNGIKQITASHGNITPNIACIRQKNSTITYSIATAGFVSISVFTAAGKRVMTPVQNRFVSRGVHTISLQQSLPSGVYLVKTHHNNSEFINRLHIFR